MSSAFAANNRRLVAAAAIPESAAWDYRGRIHTPLYIEDQYVGKMLDPRVSPAAAKQYKDEAYRQHYAELDAIKARYPGIESYATLTGRARMALAVKAQNHKTKVDAALAIPAHVVEEYIAARAGAKAAAASARMLAGMSEPGIRADNFSDAELKVSESHSARASDLVKQYPQLPYRTSVAGRAQAAWSDYTQRRTQPHGVPHLARDRGVTYTMTSGGRTVSIRPKDSTRQRD
jgi:hypothetical protein